MIWFYGFVDWLGGAAKVFVGYEVVLQTTKHCRCKPGATFHSAPGCYEYGRWPI